MIGYLSKLDKSAWLTDKDYVGYWLLQFALCLLEVQTWAKSAEILNCDVYDLTELEKKIRSIKLNE